MPWAILNFSRVVTNPVIDDPREAAAAHVPELDQHVVSPGVLAHICERLTGRSVYEHSRARAQMGSATIVELIRDPEVGAHLLEHNMHGCGEAAMFQAGRPQIEDELTKMT